MIWKLAQVTGSPMILSLALMAEFLPSAVISPFAGAFIDRCSRKAVMIISDAFIALTCAALAVSGSIESAPEWLIIAVIGLRSIGSAFQRPCMHAITPQIVPADQLIRCAGYSQTIQSVSRILSPAAAAGLYLHWSLGQFIWLDVLGAAVAIVTVLLARIPRLSESERRRVSVLSDTAEGFKVLRQSRGMLGIVLVGALYTFALLPISALFPIMCLQFFGGTSLEAGLVETLFAFGTLAGALVLSVTGGLKNKVHNIAAMTFLMTACLVIGGLLPPSGIYVFAAVSFFMGICAPIVWGSQTTLLQQNFAPGYMGRVMSISGGIRVIASPLSLSLSGLLSERFGAQIWFLIGGLLTFICGALCLAIPFIRNCDTSVKTHDRKNT